MATVYEGTILTVDDNDSVVRFLVEDRGIIEYVGDELPLKYEKSPRIDLGQDVLVPAFVDVYANLELCALVDAGVNLLGASSVDGALEAIASAASSGQGPLLAFGASAFMIGEGRLPNRDELDRACPERPVLLVSHDGEAGVANAKLIEALGASLVAAGGCDECSGALSGESLAAALAYIRGCASPSAMLSGMQKVVDRYASRGFGLIGSACGIGSRAGFDVSFERWFAKSLQNGIQARVWPQSFKPAVSMRSKIYRIGGAGECALDGTFAQGNAALSAPYADGGDGRGSLRYPLDQLEEFCFQSHNHKLQVAMRAVGDAAFDQMTRALASTIDRSFKDVHRHGVIGASLPSAEGLDTCARYGIHLMMMPGSIDSPQEPQSVLTGILGPERAGALNPFRTIWDKGIRISAGSAAPCADPDPILWMHKACNHVVPEQSLTPREALRMCTINGAWVTYDEDEYGSLEKEKVANMVRLSANPYEVPVQDICKIQVKETILDGCPYKPQRQGLVSVTFNGLFCYGYC